MVEMTSKIKHCLKYIYINMCTAFTSKSKVLKEMMKYPFHHRAFYCYLIMSIWIFFLVTAMYKYISTSDDLVAVKRPAPTDYFLQGDSNFRRAFMKSCNPPDNIVRGSEGAVDHETWLLRGVLVVTRHGDRGPLTHLKGGDKLPCDTVPSSPLLQSYESFVRNVSGGQSRGGWSSAPGPFHNFPALPAAPPHCALGQLTPTGLLQMIRIGAILRSAYAEKLELDDIDPAAKRDNGEVISYSTRYRRTYQSLLGTLWGASPSGLPPRAARARASHALTYCYAHCACAYTRALNRKIKSLQKHRIDSRPAIKELVRKISKVIFETQESSDPELIRDALLAYMCHYAPLPCSEKITKDNPVLPDSKTKHRQVRSIDKHLRSLLEADADNIEFDYNSQLDFNNEIGRKARDIIGKYYDAKDKQKAPMDFDAQMEMEKLIYYQQKYLDNNENYDDVDIVKKRFDADFNFPNDARLDFEADDENYKEAMQDDPEEFCVKNEHIVTIFAYLERAFRQDIDNIYRRKRDLLLAYGLIHNIVQNMIRMISENKPKLVLYSGHDKTLQPLISALGLKQYQHFNVKYASRMIFEVYRRRDLRDEFKFTKRKAVAQDFFFRIVYNGDDVTSLLSFCRSSDNVAMEVVDPIDDLKVYTTYLCPIEKIVRFIHDDYFSIFNASNFKDACANHRQPKRTYK